MTNDNLTWYIAGFGVGVAFMLAAMFVVERVL